MRKTLHNSEEKIMTIKNLTFGRGAIAFVLISALPALTMAQDAHSHTSTSQTREAAAGNQADADTLVQVVRDATERFKDVSVAEAAGYALQFGCVTGPDSGAMGLHYVNGDLVSKGILDATRPQIVIYEPIPGQGPRLIGADFLLIAKDWDATHSAPPQLMGQMFHYWEAPNRFGLPAFYTLHVWAWKDNPNGAFVNWHPNVSCQTFSAK
jgi:hypothetical protein